MNETKDDCLGRPGGVQPIRKRAFHRALKSKKPWAVYKQLLKKISKNMERVMYGLPLIDECAICQKEIRNDETYCKIDGEPVCTSCYMRKKK